MLNSILFETIGSGFELEEMCNFKFPVLSPAAEDLSHPTCQEDQPPSELKPGIKYNRIFWWLIYGS